MNIFRRTTIKIGQNDLYFSSKANSNSYTSHKYCLDLVRYVTIKIYCVSFISCIGKILEHGLVFIHSECMCYFHQMAFNLSYFKNRNLDYENFLATLLIKGRSERRGAFAVRAFNVEIAKVAGSVISS